MCAFKLSALFVGALLLSGCAAPIERWIVNTRIHQGDFALARGEGRDAELAYRLALRVAPNDERARAGFVQAAAELARQQFSKGNFDDALLTVDNGLAVNSQSAALAALKQTIDQAKLKQEIVVSNYPTFRVAGTEIQHAYKQLDAANALILRDLRRFGYTFDADNLTAAIKRSYELEIEVARDTNRLVTYRQLVSSGVPVLPSQSTTFGTASLLPLP